MPEPVVEFDNVSFGYDHNPALQNVSFELYRGEVVGLLGPNGAGKSTIIKILAGILAPGEGRVSVAGFRLPEFSTDVKQRTGYVPESAMLYESLTGQEFLELAGRLHEVNEKTLQDRIRGLLELFELTSNRVSRLDTYSKGMRQKILIAAALLHGPELILLDEPLSGLDVNAAILVKDLIAALAADGRTVLYSSHVLDVVEKVCHRALIIHRGKLIAQGAPEELRAAAGQATLEAVFRELTRQPGQEPGISNVVTALRS